MIQPEHNTISGLLTYLRYRKDTGHPAARFDPDQEESWADLLEAKLNMEMVPVCKVTPTGLGNPLILEYDSNSMDLKEEVQELMNGEYGFTVEFTTMPLYKLKELPEHTGW